MPAITINATAAQAARATVALGKSLGLQDNAVPPQPRPATAEELRQWIIGRIRELVTTVETVEQNQAIIIAPFDPT